MIQKLLFIAPSSPFQPHDGKRQRTLAFLLAALQEYSVDFVVLDGQWEGKDVLIPDQYKERLRFLSLPLSQDPKWVKKLGLSFLPNSRNQGIFEELLATQTYDRIFCRYASSARDLPSVYKFIVDVDDEYEEWMQSKISNQSSLWKRLRLWQIYRANLPFYKRLLDRAGKVIWVKYEVGKRGGHVLTNLPFQILFSKMPRLVPCPVKDLLFVGKLSYEPNSEGLKWFLGNVWPKLKAQESEVKLTIVSSGYPSGELQQLISDSTDVSLKLDVPRILEVYLDHKVAIVPIFFGGGSNVKLSESLIMGRSVVTSKFGARGFSPWVDSGLVAVATTPEDWVAAIKQSLAQTWEEGKWEEVRSQFSLEAWNKSFLSILRES
ncbi:MAG: glycosyltransferase [Algoriphagus sp.]|nr:glycosyltransferase [Algoriphagus sp.]